MLPSFVEPTHLKERDNVTWKAETFLKAPKEKEFMRFQGRKLENQKLKGYKDGQVDQQHKVERLRIIPAVNGNMGCDRG